jgi:hypothetical protein
MKTERRRRGRERFEVTAGGDNVGTREEGGGPQGERKSNKARVTESRGAAGPCENQVKLVPGPVCGRRRG